MVGPRSSFDVTQDERERTPFSHTPRCNPRKEPMTQAQRAKTGEVPAPQREAVAAGRITLPVEGMTCASCVAHVEEALRGVAGVSTANVNLATERATVEFDPKLVSLPALKKAVDESGYAVPTAKAELAVG